MSPTDASIAAGGDPWTAGFARRGITPDREVPLIGYEFRYSRLPAGNDGPWPGDEQASVPGGPLFAQVMVLHDGQSPLALVTLDYCTLEIEVARQLRQAVAGQLSTPVERVIIACSHTHSGPFPMSPDSQPGAIAEDAVERADDPAWALHGRRVFEMLRQEVVTAATLAEGSRSPVSVGFARTALGLGYQRRVAGPDGVEYAWNPRDQAGLPLEPAAEDALVVASFDFPAADRRVLVWNAAAHPVGLGKTSRWVSRDWPGAAQDCIRRLIPRSEAMFLLGACGDSHGWIATQDQPADLEPLGLAAGGMVASLAHACRPVVLGSLPGTPSAGPVEVQARTVSRGKVELDLVVWRLGELRVAAVGAEVFGELAVELRKVCPGPLLLATEANGRSGYWPTRKAFDEGGYEVSIARDYGLQPGDGEWLMEQVAEMLA